MEIKKERYTFVTKCEYYRTSHNWYYVLWYDGKDKPARPVLIKPARGYHVPPVEVYVAVVRDIVTLPSVALACNPEFVDVRRGKQPEQPAG